MAQQRVDLASLFQAVTESLAENQQDLNRADEYNQDHGSNMVQTFQTIAGALEKKKGMSDSKALAYAAKQVARNQKSGSSQLYAEHLAQAAGQFKGKRVDSQGALQLLQTLIGSGESSAAPAQPGGGDMLSMLMGGLTGTPAAPAAQPGQAGGDLLGALLGGFSSGGSGSVGGQDGLGLDDLLNAGMAFMQVKQGGGNTMQALTQALVSGSGMGNASHRSQSTQIVVNSFLNALNALNR